MNAVPLEQIEFDAAELIRRHKPQWHDRNKQVVYEIAAGSGFPFEGTVRYARWPARPLPDAPTARHPLVVRPGVFDYAPETPDGNGDWHLNFADPHLFVAYSSSLLAQDELQVAEHPVMGSLQQALRAAGTEPRTVDDNGCPTPVTISGVQRRCAIDTRPNPQDGRPRGLYGNAFARASVAMVRAATRAVAPPTISHILAMAAPACGSGAYTRDEIMLVLTTAYSGFLAAHEKSERRGGSGGRTVIHTGFWGCGAFGGNRTLMTILQALAADLAGVEVVFHTFDGAGESLAMEAWGLYAQVRGHNASTAQMANALAQRAFRWGESDGN